MSGVAWLIAGILGGALTGAAVAYLVRRPTPISERKTPGRSRRVSITIDLEEAPGSRPLRRCARCKKSVMKRREGDKVWRRIEQTENESYEIHYLHVECADERGLPLP